jgi:hypothetical protein
MRNVPPDLVRKGTLLGKLPSAGWNVSGYPQTRTIAHC